MTQNLVINKNNIPKIKIPIWFMRQAGRYHAHYQKIRSKYGFMEMCKDENLACEITMGPIEDFDFDSAILFSDLLFPLEHLGMGLDYDLGPPKLQHHFTKDNSRFFDEDKSICDSIQYYQFQKKALEQIRKKLSPSKSLLGFVGSPWTLFTYAVDGGHSGSLHDPKRGLVDGRWEKFLQALIPSLTTSMQLQVDGGADTICLFDTAAGELSSIDYGEHVAPILNNLLKKFTLKNPNIKITYYSKMTNPHHLSFLDFTNITTLGVDWRMPIETYLNHVPANVFLQGNIDPSWLHLPTEFLTIKLQKWMNHLTNIQFPFHRWIAGLGHGVTPGTPEINVRKTIEIIRNWPISS